MFSCAVGREEHCKHITGVYGECSQCVDHTGFAPANSTCAFPVYTAQAPCCSAWELSKVGPGFCALPSSKLLRFRFSGTPQRHRLGWACVLCPSQAQGAQVTRCLVSAVTPRWAWFVLLPPSVPATRFSGCTTGMPSQVCCVSLLGS